MPLPPSFTALINESERPVLVDFWAPWCGPCHAVAPVVERIAKEYKGRLLVVKINVDEKPSISAQYGIRGIPTLMVFHRGKVLMRESGALSYDALQRGVEAALADVSSS